MTKTSTKVILLLEDEELVRRTLQQLLSYAGYKVLEARTGKEATAICERYPGPIHIALIDLSIDNMQGLSAGRCLTAARPDLKILLMSGHFGPELISKGILTLETHFLQKPINPDELFIKLERMLDKSHSDAGPSLPD
jgi:DNA-binding NtrC family response regulator